MSGETIHKIIDLARWAPSGDNTQPWRFEVLSASHLAVHGFDTRDHVLYDFDGHASHMAHGALLETIRLAATRYGLRAEWQVRPGGNDRAPIYDIHLAPAPIQEDPLVCHIDSRCVQRRAMRLSALSNQQRQALIAAVGEAYELQFFETARERIAVARLLWDNAGIRLTCPEAYPVHRDVIDWGAQFSTDRIPEKAVGVDPLTAKLMRWVMQRWERVRFFNRYLAGTLLPRIELDLIPALACSAHVLMRPRRSESSLVDFLQDGAALQRLWLTVSALGLHLQPEMTPIIFRWYARSGRSFSALSSLNRKAMELATDFEQMAATPPDAAYAFFCRIGQSRAVTSRSLRRDSSKLHVV